MPVFCPEEDDLLSLGDGSQASQLEVDCHQYSPQTRLKKEEHFQTARLVPARNFKTKIINFPGRSVAQDSGLMFLDNLVL